MPNKVIREDADDAEDEAKDILEDACHDRLLQRNHRVFKDSVFADDPEDDPAGEVDRPKN